MNDGWWMYREPYNSNGIKVWNGGSRCAYCPSCAKTRDEWEPDWHQRKDSPELREWNAG